MGEVSGNAQSGPPIGYSEKADKDNASRAVQTACSLGMAVMSVLRSSNTAVQFPGFIQSNVLAT